MQIKQFRAAKMQDVLKKVKAEMGSEAVIISTRNLKSRGVEVTAALDNNIAWRASNSNEGTKAINREKIIVDEPTVSNGDLEEIKLMLASLVKNNGASRDIPPTLLPYYLKLVSSGIDESSSSELITLLNSMLRDEGKGEGTYAESQVKPILSKLAMSKLKVGGFLGDRNGKTKISALIGPTGVGKTTTIAKLAAELSFSGDMVAMITIDTYRIGAVEQLRTYAAIIDIPLKVVTSKEELSEAIEYFGDYDSIIIDTVGRSYQDGEMIDELSHFLLDDRIENNLVLSASMDEANIEKVVDVFGKAFDLSSLIFTKIDETCRYGVIYNTVVRSKLPLSYITNGQKVPEDIEKATPQRIISLMF